MCGVRARVSMVRFGPWGLLMGHFGDLVATQVFDLLLGPCQIRALDASLIG
jgi:hypothetical protein